MWSIRRAGTVASLVLASAMTACKGDLPVAPAASDAGLDMSAPVYLTAAELLNMRVNVGEKVFKDQRLSRMGNQSCESCHMGTWGFNGPDDGSIPNIDAAFFAGSFRNPARFGDRKPPSAAYATGAPTLHYDRLEGTYRGGNFWDGRARGLVGNSPAVDQALGPFGSDVEHAFSQVCVLWEIATGPYAAEFAAATGSDPRTLPFNLIRRPNNTAHTKASFCHSNNEAAIPFLPQGWTTAQLNTALAMYRQVAVTIADYEASPRVSPFNSKYDAELAGTETFTPAEAAGEALFNGRGNCALCHATEVGQGPEVFTDFSYYNLGVPRHPKKLNVLDVGLGRTVADPAFNGFFKSSPLRNVAKAPRNTAGKRTYMHNGVFTSLEQVVHFYNTRDTKRCAANVTWRRFPVAGEPGNPAQLRRQGVCWPRPDFPATLFPQIGNLGLTPAEEANIVAYMKTFTDR